jgi:hypothetical protein
MSHVRRIRALGERERRVIVGHLQETIDQTGWEVDEGELFESFGSGDGRLGEGLSQVTYRT